MAKAASPIPAGFHSVTPYLTIKGAAQAIEFYKRAFGAEEISRTTGPGGAVMHAELRIGNSPIMLSDEFPAGGAKSPQTLGGTTVGIFLYVNDVDAAFNRAVSAGATVCMPVADMFWGDRWGQVRDPFGHDWSIATRIEDLTPDQIAQRGAEAMKAFEKDCQ